ncbi:MAG: DUF1330 domain-containing protein [Rhodospirillales bacterium]
MPKAYWIGAYDAINDPEKVKAYVEAAGPVLIEHGGKILARGGRSATFEGVEKVRIVVVEFPDLETAETCYASDGYRAAHALLGDGGVRELFAVEGAE